MGPNKPKPMTFVKSHQDLDKSVSKPITEYNPDDLIGRTFLLPLNQKGERHRASIKQKVIETSEKLDGDQNAVFDNINFLLDVGHGRSQTIYSYKQVLNYHEKDNQEDDSLYKFRAITNHDGPLKKSDPNYNGCLYNVMVEWRQGRSLKNHCPSLLKMILLLVLHMPRNITYYIYLNGISLNT